jgi:hypothetical protein
LFDHCLDIAVDRGNPQVWHLLACGIEHLPGAERAELVFKRLLDCVALTGGAEGFGHFGILGIASVRRSKVVPSIRFLRMNNSPVGNGLRFRLAFAAAFLETEDLGTGPP